MADIVYFSIAECLKCYPKILYGISGISFSEYKTSYKCALVLAVPHTEMLSLNKYDEEKFESIICEARNTVNVMLSKIEDILKHYNIEYYIPPIEQTSEETLIAPFSFKFAAVNAGLGWIGKNDVLVTEKFGPRVRLSAILINYDLPVGTPILQSKCNNSCMLCINACPYNALTGTKWDITKNRNELIDYKLCNQKRSLYLQNYNRKNSCGLCMAACPYGLNYT